MKALVILVAASCCSAQLVLPYTAPWVLPQAKLITTPHVKTDIKTIPLVSPYAHPFGHPFVASPYAFHHAAYPYILNADATLKATEFPYIFHKAEQEPAVEEARRRRRDVEIPLRTCTPCPPSPSKLWRPSSSSRSTPTPPPTPPRSSSPPRSTRSPCPPSSTCSPWSTSSPSPTLLSPTPSFPTPTAFPTPTVFPMPFLMPMAFHTPTTLTSSAPPSSRSTKKSNSNFPVVLDPHKKTTLCDGNSSVGVVSESNMKDVVTNLSEMKENKVEITVPENDK
nr:mucin-7-like [Penaeus vannamei]